jgi:hypothetical protein
MSASIKPKDGGSLSDSPIGSTAPEGERLGDDIETKTPHASSLTALDSDTWGH